MIMAPEIRILLERALRLARQTPMLHEISYRMGCAGDETPVELREEFRLGQVLMAEASELETEIGSLLLDTYADTLRMRAGGGA